jgi:hypothetical protein
MEKDYEYEVVCHFCAVGKKMIKASSLEGAKHIAESDYSTHFDEIIKLTEPCKVDEIMLHKSEEKVEHHPNVDYKSWGAE